MVQKKIKNILFPKRLAPVRLVSVRLFNAGGRVRWWIDLFKR